LHAVIGHATQFFQWPQAIKHKLTRDGADPDRPLADEFPSYVAAMVYRYLGLKMPGWVYQPVAMRQLHLCISQRHTTYMTQCL